MATPRFLDTNILLRYFVRSDPDKARQAKILFDRVERGEERVITSVILVFETAFTLQRTYKVARPQIREMVGDILSVPGVQLPGKRLCLDALDLYVERNVSFADAFNAVYMRSRGLNEIYSWDTDFDRIEVLTRVEPAGDSI